jgi:hypothetical protein
VLDHDRLFRNLRRSLVSGGWLEAQCGGGPNLARLRDHAKHYNEFVRNIILRRHLENIPSENRRDDFMAALTAQAAKDDPPFLLDYWRLNLRARACPPLG